LEVNDTKYTLFVVTKNADFLSPTYVPQ